MGYCKHYDLRVKRLKYTSKISYYTSGCLLHKIKYSFYKVPVSPVFPLAFIIVISGCVFAFVCFTKQNSQEQLTFQYETVIMNESNCLGEVLSETTTMYSL